MTSVAHLLHSVVVSVTDDAAAFQFPVWAGSSSDVDGINRAETDIYTPPLPSTDCAAPPSPQASPNTATTMGCRILAAAVATVQLGKTCFGFISIYASKLFGRSMIRFTLDE